MLERTGAEMGRRYRQVHRVWVEQGTQGVQDWLQRALADRIAPTSTPLEVRPADVLSADIRVRRSWPPLLFDGKGPLVVNWVMAPPVAGSGGHTTIFRLIEYLEQTGNVCRVYLYDVYGGDAAYYSHRVRRDFPRFNGEIHDAAGGMADAHAVVATAWPTAYSVFNDRCRGMRFYLVQDFEPWFHPPGARNVLAEHTYRMGFHAITAGRFLAEKLRAEYGMTADSFDFGCDSAYHIVNRDGVRDGVVFYAKPDVPRRAFELGVMALQLFAERHPHIAIHFYGARVGTLPFPFKDHGLLRPSELNGIYNRCFAGLSLSMTNVSLVPHEMLSAGCIPVVNDAEHNRIVLNNSFVRYALPTPHALADALSDVVSTDNFVALATSASSSVSSASWEEAGRIVATALRRSVTAYAEDQPQDQAMARSPSVGVRTEGGHRINL
ncbi:glycosyltransferase family 1 protein [Bradyrhizobium retamae]|uniref:rhamnosyltransferase WsaF family glycosyltransferase n=1 Tax=Bradyrhizobium retamae TaxID=1300035 RepID=UPI0018D243B7|nr:glycosyltransferase family 1 protein [Bradyrhizobium retamae]